MKAILDRIDVVPPGKGLWWLLILVLSLGVHPLFPSTDPRLEAENDGLGNTGFVTRILISPKDFDLQNSCWSVYGPAYEGHAEIAQRGATHTHAFGAKWGSLTYRFTIPDIPILAADLTARLSSELPYYLSPPDQTSDITLVVNGQEVSTIQVIADNGSGKDYTWEIPNTALRVGQNAVIFQVRPAAGQCRGLCIYDKAVAPGEVDAPIRIRIWKKAA